MKLPDVPTKLNSPTDWIAWLLAQLSESKNDGIALRILLEVLLCSITLYFFLKALNLLLENVAKLGATLKDFGIHTRLSPGAMEAIRRRRQFCQMVEADLANLAKAENWNDQNFTELEAEVEAEGSYYLSNLHRAIRWKSKGMRRVPSLTAAIESSGENRILVVGDPGAGKSVALRHLARTWARRGHASRSPDALVPLYINLRELTLSGGELSTSAMKEFIIGNLRRGDADTADYIRQQWDEFRSNGQWLFLFDSFDEIPYVLHAPSDGKAIQIFSEAIRHFLDSAPACRGIVASREFKGPRNLTWHKFRILQLSDIRQEKLIDCTFLPADKRLVVKQHLATSHGGTFRNPMLLSLLCRYLKQHGVPPSNDFELLSEHLGTLAGRDPHHLQSHFGLTPVEILSAAATLARVMAETPTLGLAPTIVDLERECTNELGDLPTRTVLEALVDLKIGRVDVPGTVSEDRRFAFAHRRYQEILYVAFLREHGVSRRPREFLTNPRLREYAVTYLQSQSLESIAPLFTDACLLLVRANQDVSGVSCNKPIGDKLHYYNWDGLDTEQLLGIFREGMSGRVGDIPIAFSQAVESLLLRRARSGDAVDLMLATRFSVLASEPGAMKIINMAIAEDLTKLDDVITQAIAYRGAVPQALKKTFLVGLSDSVLVASTKVELLRLEALASRLPSSSGALIVFRRNTRLRKSLIWTRRVSTLTMWPLRILRPWRGRWLNRPSLAVASAPAVWAACMVLLTKSTIFQRVNGAPFLSDRLLMLGLGSLSFASFILTVQVLNRASPEPVNIKTFFKAIKNLPIALREFDWQSLGIVILAIFIVGVAPGIVVHLIAHLMGFNAVGIEWYLASSFGFITAFATISISISLSSRYTSLQRIKKTLAASNQKHVRTLDIVLMAASFTELFLWLQQYMQDLVPTVELKRSLLRFLRLEVASASSGGILNYPLAKAMREYQGTSAQIACSDILLQRLMASNSD